jgi:hypothetical protein
MKLGAVGLLLLASVGLQACIACELPPSRAGLVLTITDATTGELIAAGSRVTITSHDYEEIISVPEDATQPVVLAAFGRPGVYDIQVLRHGYAEWNTSGIRVQRKRRLCGATVHSIRIAAELDPL